MPVGTDTRTAASLMDAWQAIGNRINWLEAFVTRIAGDAADVHETGVLVPPDDVTFDGALTIEQQLTVNALLDAAAIRGRRRLRLSKPTASASYAAADGVDLVYVDRTDLASGTTTITIDDTGWSNGEIFQVTVRNISSGKNVSIVVPGLGTIATADTNQRYYTFVRIGSGDWNILSSNLD